MSGLGRQVRDRVELFRVEHYGVDLGDRLSFADCQVAETVRIRQNASTFGGRPIIVIKLGLGDCRHCGDILWLQQSSLRLRYLRPQRTSLFVKKLLSRKFG
ncbi:MAG: hypothetical protein PHT00_03550 [Candidatus Methanomethylophilus sp.]|nr:hypothetical protein [Methanomethylophilus sp.]MDD4222484.1 hypothetical protein [Methanomethylophilus sp.]